MTSQVLSTSVLIIGAGQAGAVTAATLRQLAFDAEILMVGDEAHPPYERPALSKEALAAPAGNVPDVAVHPASFYDTQRIHTRWSTRVVHLDPQARQALLADGTLVNYEHCVLATGGRARELPMLPSQPHRVHYLRTLDDAHALRQTLAQGGHIVVLGGGFLGLEVASTARQLGLDVSLVEQAPRLLARAVPDIFSDWLLERVHAAGVRPLLAQRLRDGRVDTGGVSLTLDSGLSLQADAAVVCVGLQPQVELARAAGLAIHPDNGGIEVDAHCRTSAHGVLAIGDCASQPLPGSIASIRLESWQSANEQARIAAHTIAGKLPAPAALPWFWTDQFGCNIQMLGLLRPGMTFHVRGEMSVDDPTPRFLMLGLAGSDAAYALAVNMAKELRALRPAIEQGRPVDVPAFLDPAVSVRALVRAVTS